MSRPARNRLAAIALGVLLGAVLFRGLILTPAPVMRAGTTYYVAAAGGFDGNVGDSAHPFATFTKLISVLQPGDIGRAKAGNYTSPNFVHINCGAAGDYPNTANNGTANAGITLISDTERTAHIVGNGTSNPVYMRGCAYWTVQGFYISEVDSNGTATGEEPGSPITFSHMTNSSLLRNVTWSRNRYYNSHPIDAIYNQNGFNLIQENECYCFGGRYPVLYQSSRNTWRRNYSNNMTATAGCDHIGLTQRNAQGPNYSFVVYDADDNIVENNVWEDGEVVQDNGSRNLYYGNVALAQTGDGLTSIGGFDIGKSGSTYVDNAFVNPFRGIYIFGQLSPPTASFNRNTVIDAAEFGFYSIGYQGPITPPNGTPRSYAYALTNTLVLRSASTGLGLQDSGAYDKGISFDYTNAFGNGGSGNFAASMTGFSTHATQTDPAYGTCKLWQPAGSPMLGAGLGGQNIGARILNRYVNGSLTGTGLWNADGSFSGCGATVAGVNDVAGRSCGNVHLRLNVNVNSCAFPAGYVPADGVAPTATPTQTPTPTPTPNPAAITYIATDSPVTAAGSSSITLAKPVGTVDGHVMVAMIYASDGAHPFGGYSAVPSGWASATSVDGFNSRLQIWTKVAASEGASYTWTFVNASDAVGEISSYSNVQTSLVLDATPTTTARLGGPTTISITAPSITSSSNGAMLVTAHTIQPPYSWTLISPNWTAPTGMNKRADVGESGSGNGGCCTSLSLGVNDLLLGAAGATGTNTASSSYSTPDDWLAVSLVLRPNVAATPTPTQTPTQTPTPNLTASNTPTATPTVTPTFTATPTSTPTATATPTATPTVTPTFTQTPALQPGFVHSHLDCGGFIVHSHPFTGPHRHPCPTRTP